MHLCGPTWQSSCLFFLSGLALPTGAYYLTRALELVSFISQFPSIAKWVSHQRIIILLFPWTSGTYMNLSTERNIWYEPSRFVFLLVTLVVTRSLVVNYDHLWGVCFQLYVCQFESRAIYVNQEQNSLYFRHRLSFNQEEDYFRFYHYPDCYLLSTYLATRARCEAGPNPPLHSTASTEMDPSSATHE